jgi:phosphomevalonate kinase
MDWIASAPGKLVLLGEYAVLDGAPALVMACGRRCRAELGPAPDGRCHLTSYMPAAAVTEFAPGEPSGAALVDAVLRDFGAELPWLAWAAAVDSRAFFVDGLKLGLGSSAAALVALAGACHAAAGKPGRPGLSALIACHRAFQAGAGSGIDVAAALIGGTIEFRLDASAEAHIGSVSLPKSVGFAGVFAGGSASTPGLVGLYRRWADAESASAAALLRRMFAVARGGCAAVRDSDDVAFVAAIDEYGRCLAELGRAIGADVVTGPHRQIGGLAGEFGLAYKVSGAGGGDVGIACGLDADALRAFSQRAADEGFRVVPLDVDDAGLRIEEHAE